MKNRHGKCRAGFTLIELMIGVAVLAILLSIAVPSFQNLIERRRVAGAAESILSALQFARSEAIKRNTQVVMVVRNAGTEDWCYGLDENHDPDNPCDCTAVASSCTLDEEPYLVSNTGANKTFPGVVLDANFTGGLTGFSPPRARATVDGAWVNGTVWLTGQGGERIDVKVSLTGRVRACSDHGFAGFESC